MAFMDMIKNLLGGDGIQSALESTGLTEHLEGVVGEGSSVLESLGSEVGGAAEALGGVDIPNADLGLEAPDLPGIGDPPSPSG